MSRIFQGVDIVGISRLREILARHRDFAFDIFTEGEREYCMSRKDPALHFAERFAAKESCLKALGSGMSGSGIDHIFKEIEVVLDGSGRPVLSLSGWAAKIAKRRGIHSPALSVSHCGEYAVSAVIFSGSDKQGEKICDT